MRTNFSPCKTRRWPWRLGVGALVGLVWATGTALAADADGDGLDDTLETQLISRFAPVVRLYPDDDYRPASVDWYLARVTMRFNHVSCEDCEILAPYAVTLGGLISKHHKEKTDWPICSHNDTIQYSWNTTPSSSDTTDFFLEIVEDGNKEATRRGDLAAAVCYAHVHKSPSHHPMMYDVQYWFFYPYNGPTLALWAHEGDWEHLTVRVEPDGQTIHRILYDAHGGDGGWYAEGPAGTGYSLTNGRPIVYSAYHSHASYPSAGTQPRDWAPDDHTADGGPIWDCLRQTVNLGEGNAPASGMEWIQYTGHWGEIGSAISFLWDDCTTGPYGPAFHESWGADDVGEDDPANHGWIFVDLLHLVPPWSGTWLDPFTAFTDGAAAVPNGGTVWVHPGNYSAVGTYSKPMTWQAWVPGSVVLGN
jgi:hypothetical protein